MSTKQIEYCDVVMKGGITSGIVYPNAVLALARRYTFKNIGGSYPEPESRLSDIALTWMIEQATSPDIPHHLLIDCGSLKLFPSSAGMQHCEIDGFANAHPRLSRWFKWDRLVRKDVLGATLHPSVLERFALPSVSQCGRNAPYRPTALRQDDRVKDLYDQDNAAV